MKQVSISVELDALVPDDFTEEQIDAITLEIPNEKIVIFREGQPCPEAKVTGYTTGLCEEVAG